LAVPELFQELFVLQAEEASTGRISFPDDGNGAAEQALPVLLAVLVVARDRLYPHGAHELDELVEELERDDQDVRPPKPI